MPTPLEQLNILRLDLGLPVVELEHSRLPPSSAFRWTVCTASVKFVEDNDAILPLSGGSFADEGTRAHTYLTALLRNEPGKPDNDEMDKIIRTLVEAIRDMIRPHEILLIDQRVPLFYLPSQSGTLDVSLVGPERIVILDLKYGVGVSVSAWENKQLAIYAESEIRQLERTQSRLIEDSRPVLLVIYQPRDRSDSVAWREWKTTRGELRAFCEGIEAKARVILEDRPTEFVPGEACKFCRADGICIAKARQGLTPLTEDDEPVDQIVSKSRMTQLAAPDALTRDQRQRIIAAKSTMIAWLEAVENQEVAELMSGAAPDKFKLVSGKANRVWGDPAKAAKVLLNHFDRDKIFPPVEPTFISPAQAETLLKGVVITEKEKSDFGSAITKPEGKPTLVPVTDKRPALCFNPLAGLYNLDTDASELI